MAQMGSFVPAQKATLPILPGIRTRFCHDTGNEVGRWNLSTFAAEMTGTASILNGLPTAEGWLVLVDELGRATSPSAGASIAYAVACELLQSSAITFFTTHFLSVVKALQRYCVNGTGGAMPTQSIQVYSFGADGIECDGRERTGGARSSVPHRLQPGSMGMSHYGILAARLAGLPAVVTDRAQAIVQLLVGQETPNPTPTEGSVSSKDKIIAAMAGRTAKLTLGEWSQVLLRLQNDQTRHDLYSERTMEH
ncbi:muts domain V-domain-containing protein [Dimargaris cristalligena]|uniref:Muts domain V-domain-containing protein n=1 Tax=Dimargaris cristalligena TaxID=215637 RepID=A0A4P9ZTP3_9FUNG|nr:muts domain V-domain-containing protein [Dimargaris cristalligena]|eukprot:RKP36857.1 muts domain V-domain-containing protein [Dimargaris cristalligena]